MRNLDSDPQRAAGAHEANGSTAARQTSDAIGARSTLGDIAERALAGVGTAERERIWLALENPRAFLEVDANLLSSTISHLIERSIATNAHEILLRARHDDEGTCFSVVSDEQRAAGSAPAADEAPSGLTGTIETIGLLGGSLTVRHTSEGHLHACIRIPRNSESARQ